MKFSSKIEKCGLSPMRKFAPYANEAAKKGKKLYHLIKAFTSGYTLEE